MKPSVAKWCIGACAAAVAGVGVAQSDLDDRIASVRGAEGVRVDREQFGVSGEGRPLHALRLSAGEGDPDEKPALLIVAGLNPDHAAGFDIALGVASALAADHADALSANTVYIVPCVNPDGRRRRAEHTGAARSFERNTRPADDDRDGRTDENGGSDLNGDGNITLMRVENPPAGIERTHMIDPDEPRMMKEADAAEGEAPTHAILVEGVDADGDGLIGEDDAGGVSLDMNFPHLWPEFKDGAGPHQLSEPESLALVKWMLGHDNIVAVVTYGPHDTLVNTPESGKTDASGEAPTGVLSDDDAYYKKVSEKFKEITKMKGAPKRDSAGAFHAWAYAQFGAWSFSTPGWVRPDQMEGAEKDEKGEGDDAAKADEPEEDPIWKDLPEGWPRDPAAMQAMFMNAAPEERRALIAQFRALPSALQRKIMQAGGGGGGRGGQGGPADKSGPKKTIGDADDNKWLEFSDAGDGAGFADWEEFDHPTLGRVEIGGFVPGFKQAVPADELERVIGEQTAFAADLLGRMPSLRVAEPRVERLGAGLWRVSIEVRNDGYLPTASAMAVQLRRLPPTVMAVSTPQDSIIAGQRMQRVDSIEGSGGSARAEWIIAAPDGSEVGVEVRSAALGDRTVTVTLNEEGR